MQRIFDISIPAATTQSGGLSRTMSHSSTITPKVEVQRNGGLSRTATHSRGGMTGEFREPNGTASTCASPAFLEKRACMLPLTTAIRLAPQVHGMSWTSDDAVLSVMLQSPIEADFHWLQTNDALQIAIADRSNIDEKYMALMQTAEGKPTLGENEFAALYRWGVKVDWRHMGVTPRECIGSVPAMGGAGETQAFYVEGNMDVMNHPHGVAVFRYPMGSDRYMLLTGIPVAPGEEADLHVSSTIEAHRQAMFDALPFSRQKCSIQMLGVEIMGNPETSTHDMGLDTLIGASTTDGAWQVVSAAGNFGTRLDKTGISAESMGFSIQRWRCFAQDRAATYMLHDGKGNQQTVITIVKAGRIEWQIALGNAHHLVENRKAQQ